MRAQVAALKQKVQAAIGEQGRAAQLALDLEGERRQHSEARHQLSSAENRWGCPVHQALVLSLPVWQSPRPFRGAERAGGAGGRTAWWLADATWWHSSAPED